MLASNQLRMMPDMCYLLGERPAGERDEKRNTSLDDGHAPSGDAAGWARGLTCHGDLFLAEISPHCVSIRIRGRARNVDGCVLFDSW